MTKVLKQYVSVIALHHDNGAVEPLTVLWKDRKYPITCILGSKDNVTSAAGGYGTRFHCKLNGKNVFLVYQKDHFLNTAWYLEVKKNAYAGS